MRRGTIHRYGVRELFLWPLRRQKCTHRYDGRNGARFGAQWVYDNRTSYAYRTDGNIMALFRQVKHKKRPSNLEILLSPCILLWSWPLPASYLGYMSYLGTKQPGMQSGHHISRFCIPAAFLGLGSPCTRLGRVNASIVLPSPSSSSLKGCGPTKLPANGLGPTIQSTSSFSSLLLPALQRRRKRATTASVGAIFGPHKDKRGGERFFLRYLCRGGFLCERIQYTHCAVFVLRFLTSGIAALPSV